MSKTFAYLRVSGESQAAEGKDGLSRQRLACETFAATKLDPPRKIDEVVVEEISGTKAWYDRPKFRDMREQMSRGDILIVEDVDRIGRDMMVALIILDDMDKRGVSVYTAKGDRLKDDPFSKIVRAVIAAMADYQRYMIVERTSRAKAACKLADPRHKTDGRYPYGHHPMLPHEAEGLELIMEMAAQRVTLQAIADALWAAKIPPRGKLGEIKLTRWNLRSIAGIIVREKQLRARDAA